VTMQGLATRNRCRINICILVSPLWLLCAMTDAQVEAAAQAIRYVFVTRLRASSMEGWQPTPWEKLKEAQRQGYREEARAALKAAGV
jgi:hypothetical protein